MRRLLLAAKAEAVLAVHLVIRHRTPRLAALLLLVVVLSTVLRSHATEGVAHGLWSLLLVCGTLAAVSGSRLMAPGAALSAAYRAAAPWWLVPAGRLAGAMLVVLPVVGVTTIALGPSQGRGTEVPVLLVSCVYTGAVALTVAAATPVAGSSAAAALGLLLAWLGGLRPVDIYFALEPVPFVQRPIVFLWNVLPLNWRAVRWMEDGVLADGLLLGGWLLAGVCVAGWAMPKMYRLQGHAAGAGS